MLAHGEASDDEVVEDLLELLEGEIFGWSKNAVAGDIR